MDTYMLVRAANTMLKSLYLKPRPEDPVKLFKSGGCAFDTHVEKKNGKVLYEIDIKESMSP